MQNITKLEQAVYEKELAKLTNEIAKGFKTIQDALSVYNNKTVFLPFGGSYDAVSVEPDKENKAIDEFLAWISNIASIGYRDGAHLNLSQPDINKAPEFLRRAILRVAVNNFMEQVEQISGIQESIQQIEHQVNQ